MFRCCPLCPQKQTYAVQLATSAKGQERTNAAQQKGSLFDQLVSTVQQRKRQVEAERSGGFEIDNELEFHRLLDR